LNWKFTFEEKKELVIVMLLRLVKPTPVDVKLPEAEYVKPYIDTFVNVTLLLSQYATTPLTFVAAIWVPNALLSNVTFDWYDVEIRPTKYEPLKSPWVVDSVMNTCEVFRTETNKPP